MPPKQSTKAGQSRLTGSFGVSKRKPSIGKDLKKTPLPTPIEVKSDGSFTKHEPELPEKKELKRKPVVKLDPDVDSKPSLQTDKPEYKSFLESSVKDSISKPIHQEEYNTPQKILRQFDMTASFGPTAGISRIERWNRANKLGLNPPLIVKEILDTKEGSSDSKYSESYLYGYI